MSPLPAGGELKIGDRRVEIQLAIGGVARFHDRQRHQAIAVAVAANLDRRALAGQIDAFMLRDARQ